MRTKEVIILAAIILISTLIRFIALDKVPAGLYVDEASLGYNAYSFLLTGKDEVGMPFPIYLRSFAVFTPPLYSYLTTIFIAFLGLNIFSVRFLSALSGVILVLLTYLILKQSQIKGSTYLALFTAFIVGLSPWAIFQSRTAQQANLGLTIFVLSLYLFLLSLKKIIYFIPAAFILALSAYTYHAERVYAFLFLPLIIILFRKYFVNFKKIIFLGIIVFLIITLPQILALTTPGSLQRYNTQGYTQEIIFGKYGGNFKKIPIFGRPLYIINEFVSQYLAVYSPRSLFFEPENQTFRSMPTMSTFYFWMVVPFFLGIKELWKRRFDNAMVIIIACIIFGSLPKAITSDPFYTLRFLPTLWGLTILMALGIFYPLQKIQFKSFRYTLAIFLIVLSSLMFYISYFIIFKHERSYAFGYPYLELAQDTEKTNKKFVLDTEIYDVPYILMAFYKKYDPVKMQAQADPDILKDYYTSTDFNKYLVIDNVNVRHISFGGDPCIDQIIVGDVATLSETQALEHHLKLIHEYKDLTQQTILWAYQTDPSSCQKRN